MAPVGVGSRACHHEAARRIERDRDLVRARCWTRELESLDLLATQFAQIHNSRSSVQISLQTFTRTRMWLFLLCGSICVWCFARAGALLLAPTTFCTVVKIDSSSLPVRCVLLLERARLVIAASGPLLRTWSLPVFDDNASSVVVEAPAVVVDDQTDNVCVPTRHLSSIELGLSVLRLRLLRDADELADVRVGAHVRGALYVVDGNLNLLQRTRMILDSCLLQTNKIFFFSI